MVTFHTLLPILVIVATLANVVHSMPIYLASSPLSSATFSPTDPLDVLKTFIVGEFDNEEQVATEVSQGGSQHPFARLVCSDLTPRVAHIPASVKGFIVLEEQYFTNMEFATYIPMGAMGMGGEETPHSQTMFRPTIILYEKVQNSSLIQRKELAIPPNVERTELHASNPNLFLEFDALSGGHPSEPIKYDFDHHQMKFSLNGTTPISRNASMHLEEVIERESRSVREAYSNRLEDSPAGLERSVIYYSRKTQRDTLVRSI